MADNIFRSSTDDDTGRIADFWVAEFGSDAAWHIARKIDDLVVWGDPVGAAALRRVRKAIKRKDAVAFASLQSFIVSVFETIGRAGTRLIRLRRPRPLAGPVRAG